MAMNATRLKNAISARLKALYRTDPPLNEQNNEDYFLDKQAEIIAEEVVNEIVTYARCSGNDSNGDSHNNVGII